MSSSPTQAVGSVAVSPSNLISDAPNCASLSPGASFRPCNIIYPGKSLAPGINTIYTCDQNSSASPLTYCYQHLYTASPSVSTLFAGQPNPSQFPSAPSTSQCSNLPPTNFTPSNAAQCAQAMNMGQSCDMETMGTSASAYAQGIGFGVGGKTAIDASSETGCSNMAVLYSSWQQATNTVNCILTTVSSDTNVESQQVNEMVFMDCNAPGTMITKDGETITCATPTPVYNAQGQPEACLSQSNQGTINATLNVTSDISQGITNAVQQTLTQGIKNMQSVDTGLGATVQNSKTISEVVDELSTNTVNENMYNQVNDVMAKSVQKNKLVLNCGGGCLPCANQSNAVELLAQNVVSTAMNNAFGTSQTTDAVTNLTNSQTSKSTGAEVGSTANGGSMSVVEIVVIIVIGIVLIALIFFLPKLLQAFSKFL